MKSLLIHIAIAATASMVFVACGQRNPDTKAASELAGRIVPEYAGRIVFKLIEPEDGLDCYRLESRNGKLVISGNNAGSMAVGLNRYLNEFCNASVSWYDYNPVTVPEEMPGIGEPVSAKCRVSDRFFLNYCTFGYTLVYWQWGQWERFIDWMALNGINMPLAITGEEAAWQKVWRKHGMTDEQIRAYFTGPAHLPWQRMCNVDRFQGPLPQEWIDSQAELQKKIVTRERELSMTPVLQGFGGHIPGELEGVTLTSEVSRWGGFDKKYNCTYLSAQDPMYASIQKEFIQAQTELYGTDHIYGVDLFNEVQPPCWDPDTLAAISKATYESLEAADPDATWLQMSWLFFNAKDHWTPDVIKSYLSAVPAGRVKLLDYYCEYIEIWQRTESFFGQPSIWCYLGNFGGNTMMDGNPRDIRKRFENAIENDTNMSGVGATLEGFGVNEMLYEFLMHMPWEDGRSDDEWVDNLADRHFGAKSESFRKAWNIIVDSILVSTSYSIGTMTNFHPCESGQWSWLHDSEIDYTNGKLLEAWKLMLQETSDSELYLYDIVNVGRQYIGNCFRPLFFEYMDAVRNKNLTGAESIREKLVGILDDMETLLSARREFSLKDWTDKARAMGEKDGLSDYYELNARTILSVWGDSQALEDYANRSLAGLMSSLYKPRWEMFFNRIEDSVRNNVPYSQSDFDKEIWDFEQNWILPENRIAYPEQADAVETAKSLLDKYSD